MYDFFFLGVCADGSCVVADASAGLLYLYMYVFFPLFF
jgi:hypothetical protein